MKAVYAGSFDPFTSGHMRVVKEATLFFDTVYIVMAVNAKKKTVYDRDKMMNAIVKAVEEEGLSNKVVVMQSDGLTVDVCDEVGATYIVRGLRNTTDYMYEEEISKFNAKVNPKVKTIYFRAEARDETLSSSVVRELFSRNKDISEYVPQSVILAMQES